MSLPVKKIYVDSRFKLKTVLATQILSLSYVNLLHYLEMLRVI